MRDCAAIVLLTGLLGIPAQAADKEDLLRPFLKSYCVQCHGQDKQKGDRSFDQLTGNFGNLEEAESFQEILDQLNLGEMPPKGKPQPKADELLSLIHI